MSGCALGTGLALPSEDCANASRDVNGHTAVDLQKWRKALI
jgi:hypothetical protein